MASTVPRRTGRTGRAEVTRDRILGAARAAFAAKGYDGTNLVGDVLTPAGVSAGSFYHQFRSKAELYAAVVQEASAGWRSPFDLVAEAPGPVSLVDVTRSCYTTVFDLVDQHEDLVRIQFRDRDHPDPAVSRPLRALRQGWIDTLTTSYRGLTPDPRAAAELTVALFTGAVGLYLDIPRSDRATARTRLVENLTTFTLGGLTALATARGLSRS